MNRKKKPHEENYSLIRHLQSRVYKLESKVMYEPEKEVCEWKKYNEKYTSDCQDGLILSVNFADYFKYCPYCGKEIKIKE